MTKLSPQEKKRRYVYWLNWYREGGGREKVLANYRQKVKCEFCGCEFSKAYLNLHKRKSCPVIFPDKIRYKKAKKFEIIKKKVEIIF